MKKSITILMAFCMALMFLLSSCGQEGVKGESSTLSDSEIASNTKTESEESSQVQSESEPESESSEIDASSEDKQSSSSKTQTSSKGSFVINTTSANLRDELSSNKTTTTSSSKTTTTSSKNTTTTSSQAPVVNVKLDPITADKYYGWLELSKNGTEAEKKAYKLFAEKFGNYEKQVGFDFDITKEEVENAYNYYSDDYPQHFWRGNTRYYTFLGDKVLDISLTNMLYDGDKAKIKVMDDKVKAAADKVLKGVNSSMTAFDREVYIHNHLVNNCKYDTSYKAENAHDMYGSLVNGVAVCEGYAYAFQYLAREAGIQSIVVKGELITETGTESHAWNMVELDGNYYHIDVTSDDPVMKDGSQVLEFTYVNLTDTQIKKDHIIKDNNHSIPGATSTKYNYFDYLGLRFSNYSVDNFAKAIVYAARNNYDKASMTFTEWDYSALSSFLSKNYYSIIDEANKLLGKEMIDASGISFTRKDTHNMFSLKIVYK
ncbi:MAG: hypothetical protein IJ027_00650 [Oscillospiraceae bacterium]|nr:hypothetical protein [Oscillospiraceae bacterium]